MYDVWQMGWAVYVCMHFDMLYIQWHHFTKKDLWNKVYMNEWLNEQLAASWEVGWLVSWLAHSTQN
jgi:hypothetical protein